MLAPGVILLALLGVWLAHTVEYFRVGSAAGVSAAAFASVHVYMVPLGALLAVAAAAAGVGVWRAWWALGRRLEQTRIALGGALRGRRLSSVWAPGPAPDRPSEGAALLALWLPLSLVQAGLYLLQENVEALIANRAAPGIGAVTGIHAPVLAVHVLVAWALAWIVLLVLRRIGERRDLVVACERLLLAVLRRLGRAGSLPRGTRLCDPTPRERLGSGLWRRPPPLLLAV
jgi:hypothetical protein